MTQRQSIPLKIMHSLFCIIRLINRFVWIVGTKFMTDFLWENFPKCISEQNI